MMRHRRTLFALLAATGTLAAVTGCGRTDATERATGPPEPIRVDVAPVRRASIRTELDLVGTLIPLRATTIVSDVDGRIASFPASERSVEYEEAGQLKSQSLGLDLGHPVRQGDVLVQIDPVDIELALSTAKAEHELARRNLDHLLAWRRKEEVDRLAAMLEEAQAAADRAQADLARSEQLLSTRAVSRGQFDETTAAAHMAAAAVRQAEAALAMAKAGPTPEEVAVAEAHVTAAAARVAIQQEKLDKTTVRAPYDAVITDRFIDVGDRVTAMPRVEIMQIIDPQVLFAQVPVPERYQGVVRLGEVATVRAEGIATAFPARIDLINAKVDPETRTFRIRVTIDNRQGILKAGGFVRVAVPIAAASDVPAVPVDAVVFAEGRPAVFVYEEGRVRRAPVEVGLSDGTVYEITSGVEPGREVVVSRTSLLTDGLPVTAVRPTPLTLGTTSEFTLPPGGSRGTSGEGKSRDKLGFSQPSPAAAASDPPRGRVKYVATAVRPGGLSPSRPEKMGPSPSPSPANEGDAP